MNGGRSIGANSRWRWEGAPLQQPSCGNAGGGGGGGYCCDDGGYCVSGGSDSSMSMRAADERAAAEMLWRSHMSSQVMRDGGCGGAGGGGMGADAASGGRGSAPPTDVYSADFHGVSQVTTHALRAFTRTCASQPASVPHRSHHRSRVSAAFVLAGVCADWHEDECRCTSVHSGRVCGAEWCPRPPIRARVPMGGGRKFVGVHIWRPPHIPIGDPWRWAHRCLPSFRCTVVIECEPYTKLAGHGGGVIECGGTRVVDADIACACPLCNCHHGGPAFRLYRRV